MIDGAQGGAFEKACFDDLQALAVRRREHGVFCRGKRNGDRLFLRGLIFGICSDLDGERTSRLVREMDDGFEFDRFTGKIQRKGWANRELQGSLEGPIGDGAEQLDGLGRRIKIGREIGGEKNPAAAVKAGREMIDLEEWSGEAASIGDSPDEGVEFCVERAGRTAAGIKIVGAETDDGAKGLFPGKVGEIDGNFGIGCEDGAGGTRGVLILIDLERTREARAVVSEVPTGGVVKSGAGERASAKDEKIAPTMEKV